MREKTHSICAIGLLVVFCTILSLDEDTDAITVMDADKLLLDRFSSYTQDNDCMDCSCKGEQYTIDATAITSLSYSQDGDISNNHMKSVRCCERNGKKKNQNYNLLLIIVFISESRKLGSSHVLTDKLIIARGETDICGYSISATSDVERHTTVVTHATGHILTMKHRTAWNCYLRCCSNLDESDKHSLRLCPECMAKVCYSIRTDPVHRYLQLAEFCTRIERKEEGKMFERSADTLLQEGYPWNPNLRRNDDE